MEFSILIQQLEKELKKAKKDTSTVAADSSKKNEKKSDSSVYLPDHSDSGYVADY